MLLNLSEKEEAVLSDISVKQEISKTTVMRQALRLYQLFIDGKIELKNNTVLIGYEIMKGIKPPPAIPSEPNCGGG